MLIKSANSISGSISLPGDKSISHRAAMIGAIAKGTSTIENFSDGKDCASTIRCLRQLGVAIEQTGTTVVVHGVGKKGFREPSEPLDCGNSGTTMRLLAGLLAGQSFCSVLTGDESLQKRPMNRIIEPLREMGANIASEIVSGRVAYESAESRLRQYQAEILASSSDILKTVSFAYQKGGASLLDLLSAQRNDNDVRLAAAQAAADKANAAADLRAALNLN